MNWKLFWLVEIALGGVVVLTIVLIATWLNDPRPCQRVTYDNGQWAIGDRC